jgi:predicted PhzF superfamily epimerase YddE/YHI9
MKNTVLKYDKIGSLSFISEDYTSKKMSNIRELPELSNADWVEYIELYDNQTIEQISYILYDSANYWDLLIVINNIDPLFDMSYEFDILEQISENKVQKYLADYSGAYKNDTYERLKALTLTKEVDKNEVNRQLKIIKPEKLYDFISLLKEVEL